MADEACLVTVCLNFNIYKDIQMPKLKTKSSAKKRFSYTSTRKVKCTQAGKQHGMVKRTKNQIRNLRGTTTLCAADASIVKKNFMPYIKKRKK